MMDFLKSIFFIKNDKSKMKRFIKGLIIGFNMPLLPKKVDKFHNNPIVRILRVLGGISLIICVLKLCKDYLKLFSIISIIYGLYIIIINLIKIVYIVILWRNGALDVRNSPLDRLASLATRIAVCVKGSCSTGFTAGTALAVGGTCWNSTRVLAKRNDFFQKSDTLLTLSGLPSFARHIYS